MSFVRKFLDVSTIHLSVEAIAALEYGNDISCSSTPHGWWVWVFSPELDKDTPKAIRDAFELARSQGCDYIQFDCDAMIHPLLPQYEDGKIELKFGKKS